MEAAASSGHAEPAEHHVKLLVDRAESAAQVVARACAAAAATAGKADAHAMALPPGAEEQVVLAQVRPDATGGPTTRTCTVAVPSPSPRASRCVTAPAPCPCSEQDGSVLRDLSTLGDGAEVALELPCQMPVLVYAAAAP